jgi:hypothetical protein
MTKPKFYQSVLKPITGNVLNKVYPHLVGTRYMPTMEERLGDAECPNCPKETEEYGHKKLKGYSRWMLLPEESVSVTQGGKPYIECLDCGYITHL